MSEMKKLPPLLIRIRQDGDKFDWETIDGWCGGVVQSRDLHDSYRSAVADAQLFAANIGVRVDIVKPPPRQAKHKDIL